MVVKEFMRFFIVFFMVLLGLFQHSGLAANNHPSYQNITTTPVDNYIDFREDTLYLAKNPWELYDTIPFVYYDTLTINPIFMPMVFDGKVLPDELHLYTEYKPYLEPSYLPKLENELPFEKYVFEKELRRKAYLYYSMQYPLSQKYTKKHLPTDIPVATPIKVNPFKQIFQVERDVDFSTAERPEIILPKRRYWIANFETSLQFSQNHISKNWHKGGNSNFNLLSINKFKHEYEKEKIKVSNTVEYKLSIYTTPSDTLRSYRIGDDAFSAVTSFGYKAFSNWFYSAIVDLRTQMLSNYFENKLTMSSAFLSPITLNLGVGMEYKLKKEIDTHKKIEISTNLSPFSYNMKYINEKMVDRPRHGLKEGENFMRNLGSKIQATFQYNIDRNISWNSRVYYFTNYEKVEAEFENTLNLGLSRYFSTRLYVNIRFDDNVTKANPKDSYFQLYEILSFGFNYRFQ